MAFWFHLLFSSILSTLFLTFLFFSYWMSTRAQAYSHHMHMCAWLAYDFSSLSISHQSHLKNGISSTNSIRFHPLFWFVGEKPFGTLRTSVLMQCTTARSPIAQLINYYSRNQWAMKYGPKIGNNKDNLLFVLLLSHLCPPRVFQSLNCPSIQVNLQFAIFSDECLYWCWCV